MVSKKWDIKQITYTNLEKTPYMKLRYWQIYKAINKSTGESLSAFIFEKKNLEKKTEEEKNTILLLLKKEPESLIKGKNKHKNFLKVIEPLAEDSYSIGFITEYVNYNLKDWIKEYKPNMLEIKYIIYQIISVVITLHSEFQISHNIDYRLAQKRTKHLPSFLYHEHLLQKLDYF